MIKRLDFQLRPNLFLNNKHSPQTVGIPLNLTNAPEINIVGRDVLAETALNSGNIETNAIRFEIDSPTSVKFATKPVNFQFAGKTLHRGHRRHKSGRHFYLRGG